MASRNSVIRVEPDLAQAYNAAPKQEQEKIKSALRRLLQLVPSAPSAEPRLSPEETALFLRINRVLPVEKQGRYNELRQKREDETLTAAEHAELLQFVEEIQDIWADRLQALYELAQLRHTSPQELLKQLEIEPLAADV